MQQINLGDEIIVKILQINEEGDGLANYNGYVIFIQDTLPHQVIKAEVTKMIGKMIYAKVLNVVVEEKDENKNTKSKK